MKFDWVLELMLDAAVCMLLARLSCWRRKTFLVRVIGSFELGAWPSFRRIAGLLVEPPYIFMWLNPSDAV